MKFEKSFILEEGDALMKKALERAKAVIARDEIKIDDFVDLYGSERLSRDRRYVEQRERQFLERNSSETAKNAEWAKVFEAILHEHGEQSNWFGAEATTLKTSRYDDIINGVDELIEYQKEDSSLSFLALAVDATYSHETRGKLRRIKGEIDAGNLATIRYFAAENVDIKGELKNIPHVIVGTDRSTLLELSELWLQGKNGELAIHHIQFQILEEIISQCETFGHTGLRKTRQRIFLLKRRFERIRADIIYPRPKSLQRRKQFLYRQHSYLPRIAAFKRGGFSCGLLFTDDNEIRNLFQFGLTDFLAERFV